MVSRILVLILLTFFVLLAQTPFPTKKIYKAQKVNPHPPTIDGKMTDSAWKHILEGSGFIQNEPYDGAQPTEQTLFKIAYDQKNLYVCIRANDSHAEQIVARVARRDEGDEADMVGILLDSYFDHRTAFGFGVNAAGVRMDAIWSEDGDNEDDSWDPVWEAKVSVDDSGWTAEMRIPFSQLRFANKEEQIWGLQVYRKLFRKQELSFWQPIPRDAPGFVHLFGELHGIREIEVPRRIELLPYWVSKLETAPSEAGNPFATGHKTVLTGGLDGKVGVTSDLTLDLTVNPDFGQVEADPSVVNLSAFETFYEEKRPFFIEGKNILNFGLGFGDGDISQEGLFYSRRIGRTPHHYPDVGDNAFVNWPENTTILTALKLTGKTRSGVSVGILEAVTAEERASIDSLGYRREEIVEPLTNYFVGRFQKDYNEGNTILGGMVTSTNRRINRSYLNFLNRSAYTGGIDFQHQWHKRTYFFTFKTAYSYIKGSKEALWEVQRSSARYFQRPDANYVTLDSNRTSLFGTGGALNIGRGGNGHWRYAVGGVWRSPGLELNDLGFLRNADQLMQFVWVGYRIWNPVGIFRRLSLNFNQWNGWNFGGEKLFTGGNINGGGEFLNYWGFWAGVGRNGPSLSLSALRGGPAMKFPGSWQNWYNLYSDERKSLRLSINGFNRWSDDGVNRSHSFRMRLKWKPNNAMDISVNPFYEFNKDDLQYLTTIESTESERYIFGRLIQKTLGIVFRLNYSLTPNLSLQFYGQPFVSAGKYSNFKHITAPRAAQYEERFHTFTGNEVSYLAQNEIFGFDENGDGTIDYTLDQPDFNFKEFRSNLVVRWEYKPGSTLFLVWSQGRSDVTSNGSFSFNRDFRELFSLASDNVFLIKINHWFFL